MISASSSIASQIAECSGRLDWDSSPVVAKIFSENNVGKIVVQTKDEILESPTKIDFLANNSIRIYDNDYVMDFIVSSNLETSVGAFREGVFFVSDFVCTRTN